MVMLKVKLINEKTPLKIKMVAKFPNIILANLQDKVVNPSVNEQIINADFGYDGLNNVTINPVTKDIDSDIKPENIKNGVDILGVTGSLEEKKEEEEKSVALDMLSGNQIIIPTENKVLSKVTIEKPSTLISDNIKNGVDIGGVIGTLKDKTLGTKTITANGTYKATDDNLDGYSEVNVETSGVDISEYWETTITKSKNRIYNNIKRIPEIDTSNLTSTSYLFANCLSLIEVPLIDTSNSTNFSNMFQSCESLIEMLPIDTSKATNMNRMFYGCYQLKKLPKLNTSNVTDVGEIFFASRALINLGGFENLGQAYSTSQSANTSYYNLDLHYSSNLTEQSLINVLNNLYDIKTKGCNVQQVVLGSSNISKLTSEEGQQALTQAQNYGWNIS